MRERFIQRHWRGLTAGLGLTALVGGVEAGRRVGRDGESKSAMAAPTLVEPRQPSPDSGYNDARRQTETEETARAKIAIGAMLGGQREQDAEQIRTELVDRVTKKNQPIIDEWMRRYPAFKIKFYNVYDWKGNAQYNVDYFNRFRQKSAIGGPGNIQILADGTVEMPRIDSYSKVIIDDGPESYILFNEGSQTGLTPEQAYDALGKMDKAYDAHCANMSGYMTNDEYIGVLNGLGIREKPGVIDNNLDN